MWKKILDWVSMVLVSVGALNWGFIGVTGLFGSYFNLVTEIAGTGVVANIIYTLVGFSAIWLIIKAFKGWK